MTATKTRRSNETKDAPAYGSQQYWDGRYKKFRLGEPATESQDKSDDDELAYHSWYFTYQDLRPLLLPLILGGRNEAMAVLMASEGDGDEGQEQDPEVLPDLNGNQVTRVRNHTVATGDTTEEFDEGEEEESDDEGEEDEPSDRAGLAVNGPISVLEVGCGDVPLGDELAKELEELEAKTGAKAGNIVKRIVCTDYSSACISTLESNREKRECSKTSNPVEKSITTQSNGITATVLEFQVADARKMTYQDESFDLVLEKGTLDAMLSDTDVGEAGCVAIVTECARILKTGGYLVVVSHLNAHTNDGLEWLEEVVVKGLRASGNNATWEVEIHGNDGDDDEEPSQTPLNSPGPAVYIINKRPPPEANENQQEGDVSAPSTIPLRFFSY